MRPQKSYRIWMTQRSGSSLLCKAIASTQLAGNPNEFFNFAPPDTFFSIFEVDNYEAFREKLWEQGTVNGIIGIKHSYTSHRYDAQLQDFKRIRGITDEDTRPEEELWSDLFPNCKHIFLTRRNKIRQVVSWWKAIKDEQWHLKSGATFDNSPEFFANNYDFAALSHLLKELALRDSAIQAYFKKHKIQAHSLVYEDMIQDLPASVHGILEFLEIDNKGVEVAAPYYGVTANQGSEQWVQQFREDLQKDWENRTW